MTDSFRYDAFLSHSTKDKAVVRSVAERLRNDGVKVWFDEWLLKPGDSIPAKIEEGLEHSRVIVLCMSANAFGSDWSQLEAGTFRFRDPLNRERRFIPLRLDDAPIKGSLAQFLYINWLPPEREHGYPKLLEACRPPSTPLLHKADVARVQISELSIRLDSESKTWACAFSPDRKCIVAGGGDKDVSVYALETGRCLKVFKGHEGAVYSVSWSDDQRRVLSGSIDKTVRLWDLDTGRSLRVLQGHTGGVLDTAWSSDQRHAISCSMDGTVRMWDVESGDCVRVYEGHTEEVEKVALSTDHRRMLSGSWDTTLRLWEIETGRCIRVFEGHTGPLKCISCSSNRHFALSGSADNTLRLWDLESGKCLRVLAGHSDYVRSVAWSPDNRFVLTGADDRNVFLWDVIRGQCLCKLTGQSNAARTLAWSADGCRAFSCDLERSVQIWDLSDFVNAARLTDAAPLLAPEQVQYTNAKVLLVGESGVGKTGLSRRLAAGVWEPSDSTVGAWATQWKLRVPEKADGTSTSNQEQVIPAAVEREIWLWDFGGQADQRLIHQLYMDETALAVLVFDGQKEDLFETLGQWDRDLTRASRKEFAKLLVAGRVDAGGLRASRSEVEKFVTERKYLGFLETSAKQNVGCEELKQAIQDAVNWDEIPCRTTELLFKRLKEEIIRLKDEGRVLMRFNELRETLQLRLSGEFKRFADEELQAVLTLLAGPGVVWELAFGSWVLLQPERINAYGQAVIRTLQADEHQRGCLMEERILKGDLLYESSMERLKGDDERFVLLAMHQTLVERGLCLRQPTAKGNLLVFPSYYRRERPDLVQHPAVIVNYRFSGFLDEIYATLVVRLHHSEIFQHDHLWRFAADFKTNAGKQLGVKLTRRASGMGELEVYFDSTVSTEEQIIFSKYVHEHLLQHARDVERLRHYACQCGTHVGNRDVAMQRLNDWLQGRPPKSGAIGSFMIRNGKEEPPTIICVGCEKRVPLWDDMEQCFASHEIQQRVRDMREEATIELSNQSKERALVGEVISTVALANQISREFNVSDQGIDMEIEFTDDEHKPTGAKVYLQLKSGDSYLHERKRDGKEIFKIKDDRHSRYWMAQAFPVLLVIRNSNGEVRWMEVREWLKRKSEDGRKTVRQIVFDGPRFDVMSVRRWRAKVLGARYKRPVNETDHTDFAK